MNIRAPIRGLGALSMLLTLQGALLPAASSLAAERLDDSASLRSRVAPQTALSDEGRPLADSVNPRWLTARYGRVDYKLATARFVGRQARIYYVIPPVIAGLRSPAGLRVDWRGTGLFSSGTARPGERALVWAGQVRESWMSEGLDLTLQVDLREMTLPPGGNLGFESYFEIEVLP